MPSNEHSTSSTDPYQTYLGPQSEEDSYINVREGADDCSSSSINENVSIRYFHRGSLRR